MSRFVSPLISKWTFDWVRVAQKLIETFAPTSVLAHKLSEVLSIESLLR